MGTRFDLNERQNIMASTRNKLDYTAVVQALRSQWSDDHDLLKRDRTKRNHADNFHVESWDDDVWTDNFQEGFHQEEWPYEDHWQDPYHDNFAADGWGYPPEPWIEDVMPDDPENRARDEELSEGVRTAEAMAMDTQRTLTQARAAVATFRKDRGFGKGKANSLSKGKGYKGYKGKYNNFSEEFDTEYGFYTDYDAFAMRGKSKGKSKSGGKFAGKN
jgi:hypothetical protein